MMAYETDISQKDEYESLFIWDCIEKRGTPVTDDIRVVDMKRLSHEQRLIISSGDQDAIQELVDKVGDTLSNQMKLAAAVFIRVINSVYASEPADKQKQLLDKIRETLEDLTGDSPS